MRAAAAATTLVGREPDLEALNAALRAADSGDPQAVVIGGEAGIGKSRLLEEFLGAQESAAHQSRASQPAAIVLLGRCVDLGDDGAPYAPFAAVLRRLIQTVGLERVLDAAGSGAGVLSALLPELADDSSVPPRTGAERLYELVTVLLEKISADRPVILAIEDVHWADRSTLELLRFLVRMAEGGRLLVVLTYRSDEVPRGHVLRSWLPELDRTRRVTRWELARLGPAQIGELVGELLGRAPDEQSLQRVAELSEGVPFFVEELVGIDGLRSGDDLPETLRELVLARFERLSDPAQRLLRVLAAGGVCVTHELLAAVYEGSPDELDAAAREAVVANLLAADSTEYSFRHALVREAIHADLLPGSAADSTPGTRRRWRRARSARPCSSQRIGWRRTTCGAPSSPRWRRWRRPAGRTRTPPPRRWATASSSCGSASPTRRSSARGIAWPSSPRPPRRSGTRATTSALSPWSRWRWPRRPTSRRRGGRVCCATRRSTSATSIVPEAPNCSRRRSRSCRRRSCPRAIRCGLSC
ncbi:ATP-binding protein [Leifsonia xyli]|uniref:ATP-binding protein n=1 Tax=Leifsonia xyli TaxID=1575 RepID=UPI003D679451